MQNGLYEIPKEIEFIFDGGHGMLCFIKAVLLGRYFQRFRTCRQAVGCQVGGSTHDLVSFCPERFLCRPSVVHYREGRSAPQLLSQID